MSDGAWEQAQFAEAIDSVLAPVTPANDRTGGPETRRAAKRSASSPGSSSTNPKSAEESPNAQLVEGVFDLRTDDAVRYLSTLESESVDLIVTDPPYESLEKHRAIGTTTRLKNSKASSNQWFKIFPNTRFPELFHEVFRVLKKNRHFYLFCDAETMFVAKPIAEAAGFKFWKPLVWDKQKIGMGYHYRSRHEFVLFFEKGKRKLNDLGQADVIACPRIFKGYPTEKPTGVNEVLIRQSTQADEVVCDPFMGSGSAGEAALRLRRHFLGNDISSEALDVAERRLVGFGAPRPALYEQRQASQRKLI